MKRLHLALILICFLLVACANVPADTLPETTDITTVTVLMEITAEVPETTEVTTVTTAETTVETTTVTTTTTTVATTVATTATTATTTTTTTAATTAAPKPQKYPNIKTVLEGEYEYGEGVEPIIENIDGFTYVNGILIINKTYSLPEDYNPGDLDPTAKAAFEEMRAAAAKEGHTLKIISGFRPYSQQYSTYNNYAKRDGKELADRYSARAGHSEHQSGFAMDLNSLKQSFGDTKAGIWLAEHCAEYGFIIRYGKDMESSTGFMYEPWHIRYIGVDLAVAVSESGLSLEDFLGITSQYPAEEG